MKTPFWKYDFRGVPKLTDRRISNEFLNKNVVV